MAKETKEKNIILLVISIILFIAFLFLFVIYLGKNYWWILPAILYFMFFIFRESELRFKEINKKVKVKDRRNIRIDFWG